jgi:ABC-type transport system involved in multi-copper enzyme maturation permease subunit
VLNNPVVGRELLGLLRTRRSIVILAAVAVAFSLLIIARWPSDGVVDLSGATSRDVFRVFAYSLTAAVALLVPVFPSTSIVQEKQKGTLALLLNSSMGPVAIYLGKLIAALGFVALLLSATLPATAACFALGGVSLHDELLPLYLVLAVTSVLFTTWSLLVSTVAVTTDGAVRGTFGGVLVMFLLVLLPHYFLDGSETSLAGIAAVLRNISPVPAIMDVVGHSNVGSRQLVSQNSGVATFVLFGGILSLIFAGMTVGRLNHSLLDRVRSQGSVTDDRGTGVRVFRRLMFLIDPQRRKAGIGPLTNPVMVKEFRSRQFGRLHWLLRIVGGCAIVSLGLAFAATLGSEEWGVETIGGIIVSMQAALIVLFTPSLAAGLISSERESGSWELLRTTPLSAGRIVRGKLLSVIWTLLILLMASLPGYGVMIWIKPILEEQIAQVLICLTIGAIFAMLLSAAVSSFFSRTAPATVTSYSILLFLWAGSLLVWVGRDAPFGYSAVQTALLINPMAAALSVIGTPGFESYNLIPVNWWVTGAASGLLLLILLIQTRRITKPE